VKLPERPHPSGADVLPTQATENRMRLASHREHRGYPAKRIVLQKDLPCKKIFPAKRFSWISSGFTVA
jgi:hypothetical protein